VRWSIGAIRNIITQFLAHPVEHTPACEQHGTKKGSSTTEHNLSGTAGVIEWVENVTLDFKERKWDGTRRTRDGQAVHFAKCIVPHDVQVASCDTSDYGIAPHLGDIPPESV
jgi:hypothetical protein